MPRLLCAVLLVVALELPALSAPEGPQRGKIKKVDASRQTVVITAGGKDHECQVTESTRLAGAGKLDLDRLVKNGQLAPGTEVMFLSRRQDGKEVLVGLRIGAAPAAGGPGGDIRRARIKKLDLDAKTLTLTVDGKDQEFTLDEKTQVLGAQGRSLRERLKGFAAGKPVFFKAERRGGTAVIVGLKLDDGRSGPGPGAAPKVDTSKLKPLTELGDGTYQGFKGGLYPGGSNERPALHEAAGLARARRIRPLDADGRPAADGKIVLLSIGMSNTTQEFSVFKRIADDDPAKNPRLVIVDGAQGGMTARRIADPVNDDGGKRFWSTVDRRLEDAGVSRAQVQAAWIKEADAGPSQGFPGYARTLRDELRQIVQLMHERFPNLQIVYLSSRIYAGYASTRLNPEPYAYESGFSVKWLIEEQIEGKPALNHDRSKGAVKAPWLSWGPYLWANGTLRRADDLTYEASDFAGDGTHPARTGQRKVADQLLRFFTTDRTARPWFVAPKKGSN